MKRLVAGIFMILASCDTTAVSQEATYRTSQELAIKSIVDAFQDRCAGRKNDSADYAHAGEGLERSVESNAALRKLKEQRPTTTFHDSGLLRAPFPMWVIVSSSKPRNGQPRMGGCEIIWSGTFPAQLPAVLGKRLGRKSQPPDAFKGSTVYAYPAPAGGFASSDGIILLAENASLHSVGKVVPLR